MKKILLTFSLIAVVAVALFVLLNTETMASKLDSQPPQPTITVEGKVVPVAQGTYCWSGPINAKCVDMISPPGIVKHHNMKPIEVSPNAKLTISFDKKPDKLGANLWIDNSNEKTVNVVENVFSAPAEKGVYIYDIWGYWKKGDSSNVFILEVK